MSSDNSQHQILGFSFSRNLLVNSIQKDSWASRSGLQVGDHIQEWNDIKSSDKEDLINSIRTKQIPWRIIVRRNNPKTNGVSIISLVQNLPSHLTVAQYRQLIPRLQKQVCFLVDISGTVSIGQHWETDISLTEITLRSTQDKNNQISFCRTKGEVVEFSVLKCALKNFKEAQELLAMLEKLNDLTEVCEC